MYELTPIEGPLHIGFPLTDPWISGLVHTFFVGGVREWPDDFWLLAGRSSAAGWVLECDPPGYVPAQMVAALGTAPPIAACPHHRAVWAYLAALPGDTPVVLRRVGVPLALLVPEPCEEHVWQDDAPTRDPTPPHRVPQTCADCGAHRVWVPLNGAALYGSI